MKTKEWYAVRCLFEHPSRRSDSSIPLYEERTLVWRAIDFDDAYEQASKEAVVYAEEANCVFLRLSDAFHLFDDIIGSGTEVWSSMRESNLDPDVYADTFCCTPRDKAHNA